MWPQAFIQINCLKRNFSFIVGSFLKVHWQYTKAAMTHWTEGGKTLGLCMRAHISTFRISIICNITKDSQLHVICLNLCTLFTQVNTFYYQWNISIDTFYAFICDFFSAPLVFSIRFCLSRLSITRDKITSQPLSHFVEPNRAFTLKHWAIETLNAECWYIFLHPNYNTNNQPTNKLMIAFLM